MRLSSKADCALRAVRFLSTQPKGELGSIKTVAEAENIPRQWLAKILGALTTGGILVSHLGVKGGYQVARPARKISYLDVIEAVDGPLHLNLCTEDPECGCSQDGDCDIRRFWLDRENSLKKALAKKTFDNISLKKK